MRWYLKVFKQYADFTGRARRKEYWMFILFNIIALFVVVFLDNLFGFTFARDLPYGVLYLTYALAVIVPGLAVTVRRLHDTGRSGWWFLVSLIPFAGPIWLLVLMVLEGIPGVNRYGVNPKEPGGNPVKDRTKSAAVSIIIAASACIAVMLLTTALLAEQGFFQELSGFPVALHCISYLLPVALLVLGISLLVKNANKSFAAFILIAAAAIRITFWIVNLHHLSFSYFRFTVLVYILTVTYPIALLVLGIYLLQKKDKLIVKPNVAAACLLVAAFFLMVRAISSGVSMSLDYFFGTIYMFNNMLEVLIAASLTVLAFSLLQNKDEITEEDERVIAYRAQAMSLNAGGNLKIRIGFAVVNICVGVILFMSAFLMFPDRDVGTYAIIPLLIGLFLWITGACGLYVRKKHTDNSRLIQRTKAVTLVAFILSCAVVAFVIITPILVEILN